jgi:pyridoxamine 5'-phosphate oxidase
LLLRFILDISHFRRDYLKSGLQRKGLDPDPIQQFNAWFEQARITDIADPTAMVLATVSADGQPSQRSVLLKYFDTNGFVFFTNYGSRKATEIASNSKVSLLFVWLELERQIIVSGTASRISTADSARYFMSRPKDSQVAAWVSSQSHPLSSRQMLLQKFHEMKTKFAEGKIPLPTFWGGFRVVPTAIEFWQGRKNRLHDRFLYTPDNDGWKIERLAP